MKRFIVIEGEVRCISVLQSLIKSNNWLPIDVIAVLDTIVDAFQKINERIPDFLFLDTELKDGPSFDISNKKLCICKNFLSIC
jgi:hypothetical protein